MEATYEVTYPDRGTITSERLRVLARDTATSTAAWFLCLRCGQNIDHDVLHCEHDGEWAPMGSDDKPIEIPSTDEECIAYLQDRGLMTFVGLR